AQTASTDFNWMTDFNLGGTYSAGADFEVLRTAVDEAKKSKAKVHVGNIFSEGRFYHFSTDNKTPWWKPWERIGVLGCEMESYALYCNAAVLRKRALSMFTVADHFQKSGVLSPDERARGLKDMVKIAIRVAEKFA
ncbi:MAG: purine-nucleoside phosphorylase, partial [Bacilli bacterium]|nr:purine-nucleoside phosphorylase [Bacilli bacterium]